MALSSSLLRGFKLSESLYRVVVHCGRLPGVAATLPCKPCSSQRQLEPLLAAQAPRARLAATQVRGRDDGRCGQGQWQGQPGRESLRLPRVGSRFVCRSSGCSVAGKQNPKNCIFSRLLTHAQQPKNGTRTAHAFACLLGSRPRASGCTCPKYRTQRRGDGTGGAARGCGGGPGRAQWAAISTRIGGLCGECACQWGRCRRRCRWGVCRRAAIGPQS